eukprot:SM000011S19166  [mRNA]  locus=s11:1206256:1216048:+ [translate_table: standard]
MVVGFTNSEYVGDVSALCFVSWTHTKQDSVTRELTLLAGVGGHLLWYHIQSGRLLHSCSIFSGIRIHGIHGPVNGDTFPHTWDQAERGLKESSEERTGVAPSRQGEGEERRKQLVVVFGERKLKVVGVRPAHSYDQEEELEVVSSLPRLSHWILDARLLYDDWPVREEGSMWPPFLAVGLTNNTVEIWEWSIPCRVLQVACSGKAVFAVFAKFLLKVAGGTIYNKVQIWKVTGSYGGGCVPAALAASQLDQHIMGEELPTQGGVLDCTASDATTNTSHLEGSCNLHQGALPRRTSSCMTRTAVPLHHLEGHEGSIHRLSWSSDGCLLGSASDDRSARIWRFSGSQSEAPSCEQDTRRDFGIITVTVSEDCTCRVWTPSGDLLRIIRGHQGRAIWRCIYDPITTCLLTGGADASVKVHILAKQALTGALATASAKHQQSGHQKAAEFHVSVADPLAIKVDCFTEHHEAHVEHKCRQRSPPLLPGRDCKVLCLSSHAYNPIMPTNQCLLFKTEYVRCLALANYHILYVATNLGLLHRYTIATAQWATIVPAVLEAGRGPIVTMDVLNGCYDHNLSAARACTDSCSIEDFALRSPAYPGESTEGGGAKTHTIAYGDGMGYVTAVCMTAEAAIQIIWSCRWQSYGQRQLLGTFFCRKAGNRTVFTTDPFGTLTWWALERLIKSEEEKHMQRHPLLTATRAFTFPSPFGARILCLDLCKNKELLVCGDQKSNILVFSCPAAELAKSPPTLVAITKAAHGISAILSVAISENICDVEKISISSTGRDGCICHHVHHSQASTGKAAAMTCFSVEPVPGITVVEAVVTKQGMPEIEENDHERMAVGFSASDFLIWSLSSQLEGILVVEVISSPTDVLVRIRTSVYIVRCPILHIKKILVVGRYFADARTSQQKLCFAKVLGELAGGAPVRASAVATEIGQVVGESVVSLYVTPSADGQAIRPSVITVTAGAKEGMACWSHEWVQVAVKDVGLRLPEVSPLSKPRPYELVSGWGGDAVKAGASGFEDQELPPIHSASNTRQEQNDQRIMAITSFSVGSIQSRSLIVYIVAAVSDAQLRLHVFHAATDTWHLLAVLCHHAAPVLSLAHVIYSKKKHKALNRQSQEDLLEGHRLEDLAFIVCSGATDGAAAIWDVTSSVKFFLSNTESFVSEPPTSARLPLRGRGSQGGSQPKASRTRRTVWQRQHMEDVHGDDLLRIAQSHQGGTPLSRPAQPVAKTSVQLPDSAENKGWCKQSANSCTQRSVDATATDAGLDRMQELASAVRVQGAAEVGCPTASAKTARCVIVLRPVLVLDGIHQSGINSLSMAPTHLSLSCKQLDNQQQDGPLTPGGQLTLVTGGDDQAIHLAVLQVNRENSTSQVAPQGQDVELSLLESGLNVQQMVVHCIHRRLLANAHFSSVKGVWTDGRLAFSAGLDQRLRCWHLHHVLMSSRGEPEHQATTTGLSTSEILLEEITSCVLDVPDIGGLDAEPAGLWV